MSNANNVSLKRAKLHEVQHDGTSHVFVLNKGTLCEGPSPVLMLIDNAAVRIPASTAPYDVVSSGVAKDRLLTAPDFTRAVNGELFILLNTESVLNAMDNSQEMREEMQLAMMRSVTVSVSDVVSPFDSDADGNVLLDFNSKAEVVTPAMEAKQNKEVAASATPQVKAQVAEVIASVTANTWTEDSDKQTASKLARMELKRNDALYLLNKLPEQATRCREFASKVVRI